MVPRPYLAVNHDRNCGFALTYSHCQLINYGIIHEIVGARACISKAQTPVGQIDAGVSKTTAVTTSTHICVYFQLVGCNSGLPVYKLPHLAAYIYRKYTLDRRSYPGHCAIDRLPLKNEHKLQFRWKYRIVLGSEITGMRFHNL